MKIESEQVVDFDATPCRRGGDSLKWNRYASASHDVIGAWVADMDFLAPQPVVDAVRLRLEGDALGYGEISKELETAFLDRMRRLYGWEIDPSAIVQLPGVVPGLFGAVRAVGGPGDGVIAQTPNYHYFFGASQFSERSLLPLRNHLRDDKWELDIEQLNELAPRAKSFLLCNPHNPLGRVLTRNELEKIAQVCLSNDLMICSDEVHADIILDEDKPHIPIATLSPEVAQKTITLVSPSKVFNLPGIGGFALAIIPDPELRESFEKSLYGVSVYPSTLGYTAALAAYRDCDAWLIQLLEYLRGNRDLLAREVAGIDGLSMTHVEATFLAWINVSTLGLENPFEHFLAHGVALSDGVPMGDPNYLRLNFGCTRATLEEILRRVKNAALAAS